MDILIGLLTNIIWAPIAAIVTWLWARRKIRQLQKRVQSFEVERGNREVALVFSSREDITEAVKSQLKKDGNSILPIFSVHHEGMFDDQEEDWMKYVRQMKDEVKKIREYAATRIHFFTNAPVVMGIFAGALLDNGPEVVVYHYFNGPYRRIGSLSRETMYFK